MLDGHQHSASSSQGREMWSGAAGGHQHVMTTIMTIISHDP